MIIQEGFYFLVFNAIIYINTERQQKCSAIAELLIETLIIYTTTSHFLGVTFICVAFLFPLITCLMSSSSNFLRPKFHSSRVYLNRVLYFSITFINANHF